MISFGSGLPTHEGDVGGWQTLLAGGR